MDMFEKMGHPKLEKHREETGLKTAGEPKTSGVVLLARNIELQTESRMPLEKVVGAATKWIAKLAKI